MTKHLASWAWQLAVILAGEDWAVPLVLLPDDHSKKQYVAS
jgi:hypothetical protein